MTPAGYAREALERAEKATPGPWEHGDRQSIAGVVEERYGEGRCAYCHLGEPSWIGKRSINGKRMLAHVHTRDVPWWDHGIYAVREDGSLSVVNDTDEYGYMAESDAAFVAAARSDVPRLARAIIAVTELHTIEEYGGGGPESSDGAVCRGCGYELNADESCCPTIRALSDALEVEA